MPTAPDTKRRQGIGLILLINCINLCGQLMPRYIEWAISLPHVFELCQWFLSAQPYRYLPHHLTARYCRWPPYSTFSVEMGG
jgi:hypothetical protein